MRASSHWRFNVLKFSPDADVISSVSTKTKDHLWSYTNPRISKNTSTKGPNVSNKILLFNYVNWWNVIVIWALFWVVTTELWCINHVIKSAYVTHASSHLNSMPQQVCSLPIEVLKPCIVVIILFYLHKVTYRSTTSPIESDSVTILFAIFLMRHRGIFNI